MVTNIFEFVDAGNNLEALVTAAVLVDEHSSFSLIRNAESELKNLLRRLKFWVKELERRLNVLSWRIGDEIKSFELEKM